MKVFVLLAAVCGTLLGSPQSTSSNIGSNSDSSSSSSISNVIAGQIAGLLSKIYDLLGERGKDLASCSFPFTYKNVTYDNCTTDHDYYGMYWCSTKTDAQGNHAYKEWRHCQESDGLLSDDASMAANQTLDFYPYDDAVQGAGRFPTAHGNFGRNRQISPSPLAFGNSEASCAESYYEYEKKCYKFFHFGQTEEKAQEYCENRHGSLANVKDAQNFSDFIIKSGQRYGNQYQFWQVRPGTNNQCNVITWTDSKTNTGSPYIKKWSCTANNSWFICEKNKGLVSSSCSNCIYDKDCQEEGNNCGGHTCPNPDQSAPPPLAEYTCEDHPPIE